MVLKPMERGEISFPLFIRKIVHPSVRVDLRVMSDGEHIDTRAVPEAGKSDSVLFVEGARSFVSY